MNHFFGSVLNSTTTKSIAISGALAVAGWIGHALVGTEGNAQVLAIHTQQLQLLQQGQTQTSSDIKDLTKAVSDVAGDVKDINTKIDDDRRTAHRRSETHQ